MPVTEPIPINPAPRKPGPARRKPAIVSGRGAGQSLAGNRRLGAVARVSHGRPAAFAAIDSPPAAAGLQVGPNCQAERL